MKLVALDAETLGFAEEAWQGVKEHGTLILHDSTFSEEETIERMRGAEVAITNKVPFSRRVLEALPDLRLITILATGYNMIDVEAAKGQGVAVSNVPGYSTDSVAQHTLALLLHWTNAVAPHADSVRDGEWVRRKQFTYMLRPVVELSDLTVGLVGFGDIGRRIAELMHGLGARVLVHNRSPRPHPGWPRLEFVPLDEVFARSDVVSLHCPLNAASAGMIDAARLRTMKRDALLINTARGGLVVEADLAAALDDGIIAGAMLDVISAEPMREENPLREARNCWITPHIAWASERARRRLLAETVANIAAFRKGEPRHRVG